MGKGRAPCCDKSKVKRGPWSPEEDLTLITYIQKHGHHNWRSLPKLAGLMRCGKSCRLRWINYLRPDVKRGNFTKEEEDAIVHFHQTFGNKWSKIASFLPGRTDNEIKNVWNTHLKKRITTTHSLSSSSSISSAHHSKTKPHDYDYDDDHDNNCDGVQQATHSSGVSIESQDSATSSRPQAECMHTEPELHHHVNELHDIQLLLNQDDDFNDITSDFLQSKDVLFPLDYSFHQTHISTICQVTQEVSNSQSFDHSQPDTTCGFEDKLIEESDLWKQLLESNPPAPTHNNDEYNEWFNFIDNQTNYFDDLNFVGEVCL